MPHVGSHWNTTDQSTDIGGFLVLSLALIALKRSIAYAKLIVPISANAGSIEQAEDALILFDVAAIFAVVRRNADCSYHRGLLAPDTGAGNCGAWR